MIRVGVAGLGAIGLQVAAFLDATDLPLALAGVSASSPASAAAKTAGLKSAPPALEAAQLHTVADVVVEALPPEAFRPVAEATLAAGRTLVALSATQLLEHWDLVALARKSGGRIVIPTGALLALDVVRAASEGVIHSLVMKTRKPPRGLAKAPYVIEQGIDLSNLQEPLRLFAGPVRDAAQKFPANVNVAVALALAGPGVDKTQYEVWADPGVERNTHTIELDADSTRFQATIEGVPTEENPATGKVTPLSVIACLKGMVEPLKVGT
ncbi:MAG: aspartate dehydrogenase [Alphaproteobacteria bacterium]|nr:aspartate dehydrogenase [Alphaproteobacteria bacterium]